ncbi:MULTISPECIES: hypothetical protein [Haloarcula]|uniref:Uncharacterized protein n=1 Tax=Haloarcula argentinensis TaxID=43776 RepID=A0A830FWH1_HALAR|nr:MULTISPECIES: hypothetical protein [Haloarcula]MDQ2074813.1 hypothetical protein [Haloarcula sp. H-GB4]MDS0255899.1 hypothetical protein [Haloarcula argentinensis]GGM49374.1 hypothetical protein GCM10009006_33290 [Haloarcula argentinensis]
MDKQVQNVTCVLVLSLLVAGCVGVPASNPPSPDHSLYLENNWNESATFEITVVRQASNETVHDRSYVLDAGEEREVYNTNSSSPDGIETFEVRWMARNETGQVNITTSTCYGSAHVIIEEDGSPGTIYSIC